MAVLGPTGASGLPLATRTAARCRWFVVCVVLALWLVLPAPLAQAHAQLLGSTPANGSVVDKAPASVELVFNEEINPAFAQVIVRDGAGKTVSTEAPRVIGPKVIAALPTLRPGQVTVLYRVTSKDAHPISGKVAFTIDSQPGFAPPPPAASTSGTMGGDQPGLSSGSKDPDRTASTSDNAPGAWLYVLSGLAALGLLTLGAFVLRRQRRTTKADPNAGPTDR